MIGCASHRFNLACKLFHSHDFDLERLNEFMMKLTPKKTQAILNAIAEEEPDVTLVKPQRQNVTSGTFKMLQSYMTLKDTIFRNRDKLDTKNELD